MSDRPLDGRVAVVTGGGSGIGRAVVERFSKQAASVIILDVGDGGDRLARELAGRVTFLRTDVGDVARVDSAFEQIAREHGRVDVLVNSAGIGPSERLRLQVRDALIEGLSTGKPPVFGVARGILDDEWRAMLRVHLDGTFHCTRAAFRLMEPANRGAVVNVSSYAARYGLADAPHYAAAKAAIEGFTRSVAAEVGRAGIRVNAVAPGLIDTPMVADLPAKLRRGFVERTSLGREGNPREVASVVDFLASDDASYVTGQIIHVDGGAGGRGI